MKKVVSKKRKMDIEELPEEKKVVDVNVIVNQWLEAQKNICEVLLTMVNKINDLEKKLV